MPARFPSGDADVPYHNTQSTTRHEKIVATPPDLVQLVEEPRVTIKMSELRIRRLPFVLDEVEVRGGGNDQLHFPPLHLLHFAGVAEVDAVHSLGGNSTVRPREFLG